MDYLVAGIYQTTFSATDNSGANCDTASITVTVLEPETFTIGGSVSGLTGNGLVLQNNNGDDLAIDSNGDFVFPSALADGASYSVTIATQPGNPSQTCEVANGSGNLDSADITDVSVNCITDTFTVGGSVTGLTGNGLVLQNNNGDDLAISSNGDFVFPPPLPMEQATP